MSEPLLDLATLSELERRLGRERVMRVVAAQIINGRELSRRMSALEIAPDAARIRALAHQIAGSSGAIGLMRLSGHAAALEHVTAGIETSDLVAQLRDLRRCLNSSQAALRTHYPEIAEV